MSLPTPSLFPPVLILVLELVPAAGLGCPELQHGASGLASASPSSPSKGQCLYGTSNYKSKEKGEKPAQHCPNPTVCLKETSLGSGIPQCQATNFP